MIEGRGAFRTDPVKNSFFLDIGEDQRHASFRVVTPHRQGFDADHLELIDASADEDGPPFFPNRFLIEVPGGLVA